MTMEERLQSQAREIQRYRDDYSALANKFNQINQHVKERDLVQLGRLKTAESHIQSVEKENKELQEKIAKLKADRNAQHQRDKDTRKELDAAIDVLEARENQVEAQLAENNSKMRRMEADFATLKEDLQINKEKQKALIKEKNELNRILEQDMVPMKDFESVVQKLEKYQELVSKETVSLEEYDAVCDKLSALKSSIKNDYVSLDDYESLQKKISRLESRQKEMVPWEEFREAEAKAESAWKKMKRMVSRESYAHLQMEANSAIEKHMLLETSAQVLRDDKDEAVRSEKETRAKLEQVQEKLDQAEMEIKKLSLQLEDARSVISNQEESILQLEKTASESEVSRIAAREECATLSTALGNNKTMLHREMTAKSETMEKWRESQKEVSRLEEYLDGTQEQFSREMNELRAAHRSQVMHYETKCAELVSVVDILKLHLDQFIEGKLTPSSSGVTKSSSSFDKRPSLSGKHFSPTSKADTRFGSGVKLSSPYQDLVNQYLKKSSASFSPRWNGAVSSAPVYHDSVSDSSPDIIPQKNMRITDLSSSFSQPVSSPSSPVPPPKNKSSISASYKNDSLSVSKNEKEDPPNTLESLCASFKNHMSESSRIFADEIKQVGV